MPLRVPESFSTAETLPIASTAIVTMTATHAKAFPVMRSPPFLDTSLLTWVNPKNLLIALRRGRGARWNNNREQATYNKHPAPRRRGGRRPGAGGAAGDWGDRSSVPAVTPWRQDRSDSSPALRAARDSAGPPPAARDRP